MKLPTQAKSVDRTDRMGEAQAAGVNPAIWGTLASTGASLLLPYLIKGVKQMVG